MAISIYSLHSDTCATNSVFVLAFFRIRDSRCVGIISAYNSATSDFLLEGILLKTKATETFHQHAYLLFSLVFVLFPPFRTHSCEEVMMVLLSTVREEFCRLLLFSEK